MPETLESLVKQAIAAAQQEGDLPEFTVTDYCMERPADTTNGDWSSTVAMRSARLARSIPKYPSPHDKVERIVIAPKLPSVPLKEISLFFNFNPLISSSDKKSASTTSR